MCFSYFVKKKWSCPDHNDQLLQHLGDHQVELSDAHQNSHAQLGQWMTHQQHIQYQPVMLSMCCSKDQDVEDVVPLQNSLMEYASFCQLSPRSVVIVTRTVWSDAWVGIHRKSTCFQLPGEIGARRHVLPRIPSFAMTTVARV